ncbi:TonB-dependent receptor [Acetobacter sp. P1H12_c]|uniref:TonB-dependent receptor n=1 Tax=Acetobacter sp. P1H12_c TaxID=2762621 RepID=UPI001C03B841|nr:TonB-dependent receptor [Acetobacter sp. P1H12_c]
MRHHLARAVAPHRIGYITLITSFVFASGAALAASPPDKTPSAKNATVKSTTAENIVVKGNKGAPIARRLSLPQTSAGIDRRTMERTINMVDTQDALKYLPSIMLRKRNNGDTQTMLETRTWGVNSNARSMIFVDGALISALFSEGEYSAPRWGMVAPDQVERIDVLYGPFAAAYPGNSMGGVVEITTRMPDHFMATIHQTGSAQTFSSYKTKGNYGTSNTAVTLGDRIGRFSFLLSGNREESLSEPVTLVTTTALPLGAIPALAVNGKVGNVAGAGGLLHTVMNNVTGHFAWDITDWLRAGYTIGYWTNEGNSRVDTYLRTASGARTYGGLSGFANGRYTLGQAHLSNIVTLRTHAGEKWDGDLTFTSYDYLNDWQRNPSGVLSGTGFTQNGYIARMAGTGWKTADGRGIWRPTVHHEVSFGGHWDRYDLRDPTWLADDWQHSAREGNGRLRTLGRGTTETEAVWAQELWRFLPGWTLTVGGRMEFWRAFGGYNLAGGVGKAQPNRSDSHFSPKATLAWDIDPHWLAKLSFGEAWRFPIVGELYQIVSTGTTYAIPNANLTPERVLSGEAVIEHHTENSLVRLSLFQENTRNAMISQMNLLDSVFVTTVQNVRQVRKRGVEFVAQERNLFGGRLDVSNSVTFLDSRILSDPGYASSTGATVVGHHVPYDPKWRDTLQATWHATQRLDLTAALRYQSMSYSTIENSDRVSHVYGAFDSFLVADLHAHYRFNRYLTGDLGVDNVNNDRYFLYHPFMMRTWSGSLKAEF